MSKHGIKTNGSFTHVQCVDIFNEKEIKKARVECILSKVERDIRKFADLEDNYPTQLIVGYEESGNIRSALSEREDRYVSSEGMVLTVDGHRVKVFQGCKNENAKFSLVYWEEDDDINEDVDTD